MPTYSTAQFRQYVVDLLQQATGLTISIPTILSTAEYRGLVVDLLTVLAQGGGGGSTNATQLQGRDISATAPTSGQVLAWNGTVWIPTSATGSGTVTSVALSGGTTGLTTSGGPITGSGTITLGGTLGVANGGTGATTLTGYVKGNGTAAFTASATISAADVSGALAATNLPALSGDLTSTAGSNSITVAKLRGQTVSATVPTSGQILKFDGTQWAPAADAGGISSITAGTGLSGGTITTSGTISVNFGTTTGTATQGGTTVLKSGDSMTGALSIGANTNSDALTITQAGNGNAFVVGTNALIIDKTGHVGIGLTPNPSHALRVDNGGIFTQGGLTFGDNSVQTTAGVTSLTGDVTTVGAGASAATVAKIRGITVSATAPTSGQVLKYDGTQWAPAADTASNVTGTVAIANGGTGQTTANAALNALLPAQTGNNTKLLSTDGTNTSWTTAFKFSNTKVVGVDAPTIQGCIDLVSSATALAQVQVLIPAGVYNENLTLKPCVSLASAGLNNGQSSIVRIVGTHTLTGGTSAGDNIIQLNGLRMDYQAGTSPTLTISATGTTPLLVYMQDCMIGNSNASTSSVGVLVNQYCSLRCNNVKSVANSTSGAGGTHVEVNGGTFYGDQFSTEYGTLALRLSGTGGAFKPYVELKQCSLSCAGSNVVDITSTTALFSAGWTGFTNTATTGNGINIATGSVIGVFNSVFVITAGASNYVVTGGAGGVYYSLNNSYSNSTGVPYETKVNATQYLYSSSIPSAITALTGDVTASGTGSQAASVVRIQGRNVSSTAPTSGQVLAWNGTAWTPTTSSGSGTVTSVAVSGGTTGLTTSGGPITSSGTITLAGTLGVANGGTGATTLTGIIKGSGTSPLSVAVAGTDYVAPNGNITGTASNVTGTVAIANGGTGQTTAANAINALVPSQSGQSGKVLTTNGSVVSWGTAGGGGGITALTGDVTASGTGSVTAVVARLRGIPLSLNTPINNQILQYNGTLQEWQPSSSAAGAITMVAYTAVGYQTGVSLPAGYAWADIYVCSGAGGGGGGMDCMNGYNGGAAYGGGGGGAGLSEFLQKVPIDGATFEFEIGAGGAGGVGQSTSTGQTGTDGGDGMPTYLKMNRYGVNRTLSDLGKYAEPTALNTTGAQGGNWGGGAGYCTLSVPASWRSTLTQGGSGTYGVGNPSIYTGSNNVGRPISVGGSSGAGISAQPNDGGPITNIKFPNLDYSTNTLLQYQGKATSGAQDALPLPTPSLGDVDFNSLNFLGGAGGASADYYLNIPMPSPLTGYRAGNGADGQLGCGGGGGGAIGGPYSDASSPYYGGDGGDGGQGYIIFICYN